MGFQATAAQPGDEILQQQGVLEAAPRQHHRAAAAKAGGGADQIRQAPRHRLVEAERTTGRSFPGGPIVQQGLQERLPVEPAQGQRIGPRGRDLREGIGIRSTAIGPLGHGRWRLQGRQPLQPQARLPLVAGALAEAQQGGHPVEQAAQAGAPGAIHAPLHHRHQQLPFGGAEGAAAAGRARVLQGPGAGGGQQSQGHPARFPRGPVPPGQGQRAKTSEPFDAIRTDRQQLPPPEGR